jgi:hypothetical protein
MIGMHPFFVSVTEVQHNPATKSLEISFRIFTDDFENTLRMHFPGKKIDLIHPPNNGSMDSLVKTYILQKTKWQVNGQMKTPEFIGFEQIEESIWGYFEITGVPTLNELKIHNPILYEYKKEQINMVHIRNGNSRQSRKLDNPDADWTFTF